MLSYLPPWNRNPPGALPPVAHAAVNAVNEPYPRVCAVAAAMHSRGGAVGAELRGVGLLLLARRAEPTRTTDCVRRPHRVALGLCRPSQPGRASGCRLRARGGTRVQLPVRQLRCRAGLVRCQLDGLWLVRGNRFGPVLVHGFTGRPHADVVADRPVDWTSIVEEGSQTALRAHRPPRRQRRRDHFAIVTPAWQRQLVLIWMSALDQTSLKAASAARASSALP